MTPPPTERERPLSAAVLHLTLVFLGLFGVALALGNDSIAKSALAAGVGAVVSTALVLLFRSWWDQEQILAQHAGIFDARSQRFTLTASFSGLLIASTLLAIDLFPRDKINFADLWWAPALAAILASSHILVILIIRPILGAFSTTFIGRPLSDYFLVPYDGLHSLPISASPASSTSGSNGMNISNESAIVVRALQGRCDRLRLTNAMILSFVVAVIGASAVFIVFAGSIATKDTQSLDRMATARKAIDALEEAVQVLESERESLHAKISTEKQIVENAKNSEVARSAARARIFEADAKLLSVTARLERRLKEYQRSRELLAKQEESSLSNTIEPGNSTSATNLLFAAGVTRFGILALVVYLVQILINLYRYNAEVSNRYQSQIDALLLVREDAGALEAILKVLRVDVHFAKQPMYFSQKVLEQLSQFFKARGEKPTAGNQASPPP